MYVANKMKLLEIEEEDINMIVDILMLVAQIAIVALFVFGFC